MIPDEVINEMFAEFVVAPYRRAKCDPAAIQIIREDAARADASDAVYVIKRPDIRAALKAAEAMGWVMVPIKPTEPMVLAAGPLLVTATKGQEWAGAEYTCSADIGGMYSAMISAAPKIGD